MVRGKGSMGRYPRMSFQPMRYTLIGFVLAAMAMVLLFIINASMATLVTHTITINEAQANAAGKATVANEVLQMVAVLAKHLFPVVS